MARNMTVFFHIIQCQNLSQYSFTINMEGNASHGPGLRIQRPLGTMSCRPPCVVVFTQSK